jgi:FdhD protein
MAAMHKQQTLNQLTGAVHAAGWLDPERGVIMVREDVGRHNALDKLIGALAKTHCNFEAGWLLVTSRASYEMVQKAASVGITLLAAISAPTALAIQLATECGLTLVGFTRNENHVIYTHPQRLQHYQQSAT